VRLDFSARAFEWRGPAPFVFLALPSEAVEAVRAVAAVASYGWGCIPVLATVGDTNWRTSLMPKDGGYVLPLRVSVRSAQAIAIGDAVTVELAIGP
jgi:hypothetical protein